MATAKGCKRIGRAAPKSRGGKCGAKLKSQKKTTKKAARRGSFRDTFKVTVCRDKKGRFTRKTRCNLK